MKLSSLADLQHDPKNPRAIGQDELNGLMASEEEFEDISGIVWNRTTGMLVSGHQRVNGLRQAAIKRGLEPVVEETSSTDGYFLVPAAGDKKELRFPIRIVEWSLEKQRRANVAANTITIQGHFTTDLEGLLSEFKSEAPELFSQLRLEHVDLDALLPPGGPPPSSSPSSGDPEPPEPQPDRAEELAKLWGTAEGQVWEIPSMTTPGRSHRVICGSCREQSILEQLLAGARIHLAFTSPPYASQREYDEASGFRPVHPDAYVEWFDAVQSCVRSFLESDGSWFVNIKEHADGGERHLYVKDLTIAHRRKWGWRFVDELCWERAGVPGGWPNRFKNGWEPVFHFCTQAAIKFRPERVSHATEHAFDYSPENGKSVSGSGLLGKEHAAGFRDGMARPSNVIRVGSGGAKVTGDHPAEFPIGLPAFFIQAYSDPADNVYDPFLGSGTTMLAAERAGRIGYGCEISPKYLAVILQRMKDAGLEPRRV